MASYIVTIVTGPTRSSKRLKNVKRFPAWVIKSEATIYIIPQDLGPFYFCPYH